MTAQDSFAKSVLLVFGSRAAVLAAGLATSIVVARALGTEGRGQYFTIVTTATLLSQAANLGLSSSNTVTAAREPATIPILVGNSAWLAVGVAALSALVVATLRDSVAVTLKVTREQLLFVPMLGASILLYTLLTSIIAAQHRFGALSQWQLGSAAVSLALLLACAALSAGTEGFLAGTTIAATGVTGLLYLRLPRPARESLEGRIAVARAGVGYSLNAYFALLFAFTLQRTGVYVLGMYRGAADVGVYSVALQIYDSLAVLPGAAALVLLTRNAASDGSTWPATISVLARVGTILVVAAAVLGLVADQFVELAFGDEFANAGAVVRALLPGAVAIGLTAILSQFLVSREFPITLVAVWLAGLITTVLLAARVTTDHGPVGAAWAHSTGGGVVLVGCAALAVAKRRSEGRVVRLERS